MPLSNSSVRGSVFIESVNEFLQAVPFKLAVDLSPVYTWRVKQHADVGEFAERAGGVVSDRIRLHRRDVRRSGWGFKVDYPNDLWDVYLTYKEFGEGLDPALGFLPRPGTRWYQAGAHYQPRPQGGLFAWVRQFNFEVFPLYIESADGRAESWRVFTAPFNAHTQSGEHFEANIVPQFERLDEQFEIAEGVVIPPGEYSYTRFRVEAQSSRHRPWRVGASVWFGDFYTGSLTQASGFVSYTTPAGHLQLELNGEHDNGRLPEGDFILNLLQFKAIYAFTPDLILSSYIQYDSESRDLGANTRFCWTIKLATTSLSSGITAGDTRSPARIGLRCVQSTISWSSSCVGPSGGDPLERGQIVSTFPRSIRWTRAGLGSSGNWYRYSF